MPIEVVSVPYGAPAASALRDAVGDAKRGDPLAPVTVVVPTNYVGVAARRGLAGGALTPHGHGIAGASFLTLYRMAELLGAPRLAAAGRRPVSTPVLAAAVRNVLRRAPGRYGVVAEHPATEEALVEASRELSYADPVALDAVAGASARAAEVVWVYRAARATLARDWYDEADLMAAAAAAIGERTEVLADLGAVVVYLPQQIPAAAARMLVAVAGRTRLTVVAGVTGDARADAGVAAAIARLGVPLDSAAGTPPHATHVVSVSDPDDEVRAVVRMVVGALREGVALDRMAILYGSREPYARLVHEQLVAAEIPHNGSAVRTVAESVLGRSLLGLLSLPDRDFQRHDVMALLTSAPIRDHGRLVPAARWERISRSAGIVRGGTRWREQLDRYARGLEHELEEERAVLDRDPRPGWFERELAATRTLADFVDGLRDELERGARPGVTWRELAGWADGLLRRYVGDERHRDGWPAAELDAADKVEAAVERLRGLDAVEPPPGLAVFRRALTLELDSDLGRLGRLGQGIVVGHVGLGLGLELDRVFVCGLAEGTFPTRVRDDSLLPDSDRRAANGELALRASRVDDDHRLLLAALASARGERVLCFPRGDLRRTTERMPSRFLLDTIEALHGSRLYADDVETLRAEWFTHVPSFAGGIGRVRFPATAQEHRIRALLDHTRAGLPLTGHGLTASDRAFALGLECVLARAGRAFTRFDGNLAGLAIPSPTAAGAVVSPTRLESWAGSPHDYLMAQILRVDIPELPEEVFELSPLDRGTLVHEILDEFVRETLTRESPRPAGAPWTTSERTRLREIAERRCDDYEARGLTGRRLFWHRDRRRLLADLDRFLDEDDRVRAEHDLAILATELAFGFREGAPAVELPLSDGRVLRFRGAADRVDRAGDGTLWVLDYKSGRSFSIAADDPVARGTKLQLPVYARAARASFGTDGSPVGAAYWFVTARGDFRWAELELTDDVSARVDEALRTVADGIAGGVFPCRPDPPGSWTRPWRSYTDPDARGTRDRYREWERKRDAPELADYVRLSEERDEPVEIPAMELGT
jgi:RecB family exonuclease